MTHIYNIKKAFKIAALACMTAPIGLLGTLTSCSDSWDDHYPSEQTNGTESLLTLIEQDPQLSDFLKVAKATHLYNNMHSTPVTYADLLGSDQALTVWAPVNGTFDVNALLEQCGTPQGDSIVGLHFIANHIAHNLYNMNSLTDESVRMYNNKFVKIGANEFGTAEVTKNNTPALNGLLHVIDNSVDFSYNVYEALTSNPKYAHVGEFFKRYEKQELDEDRSIVAGIEDGKKVYSDSVMILRNDLFRVYDDFNHEDSTFVMLMPGADMWKEKYDEAKEYFNFAGVEKGDSIQEYWTNRVLVSDLIYNESMQRADSVFFSCYNSYNSYPYHTYQNAYSEGGPLWEGGLGDRDECSNGHIRLLTQWPYTKEQLYFHPITSEAERQSNLLDYSLCTFVYRDNVIADSISGNAYAVIQPKNTNSNWTAEFEVKNTLSGTYDVCAVILPKTVYNQFSRDTKPNKFVAQVSYMDEEGKKVTTKQTAALSNDGTKVDTVVLQRIKFPVCNYQQQTSTVSVTLTCNMRTTDKNFSREMYLDCIYLRPVTEKEESEANIRKEAQK